MMCKFPWILIISLASNEVSDFRDNAQIPWGCPLLLSMKFSISVDEEFLRTVATFVI